jgi:hypothetical protein
MSMCDSGFNLLAWSSAMVGIRFVDSWLEVGGLLVVAVSFEG